MAEKDWINEAVKEFRKGCKELQDELSKAANGTLLDVSDEQIMKNLELGMIATPSKKKGTRWNPKTISHILGHPLYAGYIYWGGVFARGRHEPIIALDIWNQAQRKRREKNINTRSPRKTTVHKSRKSRIPRITERTRLFTIEDDQIKPLD